MKIAIHVDGPVIRGNEEQVITIAVGLMRRGHQVMVSCRAGGPVEAQLRELGIETTGVRPRGDVDLWSALRFARWLRRERFDVVLLTSWLRTFNAGWAASRARVPRVVYRIGGLQPLHEKRRGALERFALRHWYHAIIANSHMVADRVIEALPDARDRIRIVPNGIDTISKHDTVPLRDQLALPAGEVLAVAVGGFERNKGFDVFIDAIAAVDGMHAVLVGGGAPEQRAALEERARQHGIADRVHMIGRRDDVPAVLAACDVFVLPSREEGFSVARLEAMRAGLPVITTDVGGTRESIDARDGRDAAGWIVPRQDPTALAAALREVVAGLQSNSVDVTARRAEAEWRIANWFTIDRMIDRYEAILIDAPCGQSDVRGR